VTSDGSEANSYSGEPSISSDGRWVAFESGASNLVSGDTNAAPDIFVHDRETGTTTRVSIASNGAQSNNGSFAPSISADGTQVVFYSNASNLVAGDTNGVADVFVHDRQTGKTTRASLASNRAQSGGFSDAASISADGRWVVFASRAENLVSGDTNDSTDVFVHDRYTGETVRASVAANGAQAESYSNFPSISGNGRWIAFASPAKNLVAQDTNNALDVFVAAAPFIPIPNYFTLHPPAFSWNRIAGAPGYEFQIDRNPDFFSPVIHRDVHDLTFTLDVSLDSGIWYWRVRAAGGTWSSPERFVIAAP
jgi:Tol biopolymer transport system component